MTRARIIAACALAVLLLAVAVLGPAACRSYFSTKTQVRVEKGQADAAINAGAEAGNTITTITGNDTATDAAVKGGIDDIRNAPAADRGLAAQRAACRLRGRESDQRCAALRAADSGVPAQAH